MKLKAIAAMCKRDKRIIVRNVSNRDGEVSQWIGVDAALYHITGMPYLNERAIYNIFDIAENKTDDYEFICESIKPFDAEYQLFANFEEDEAEGENDLVSSQVGVRCGNNEYNLYRLRGRYIFLLYDHVAPAYTLEQRTFVYRKGAIVVKSGLITEGLIFPVPAWREDKIRDGLMQISQSLETERREKNDLPEVSDKVLSLFSRINRLPDNQKEIVMNKISLMQPSVTRLQTDQMQLDDVEPERDPEEAPEVPEDEDEGEG